MLNMQLSLVQSETMDVPIYYGMLNYAGRKENIALAYSPTNEEVTIYQHKGQEWKLDISEIDTSQSSRLEFIMTRIMGIIADTDCNLKQCLETVDHNRRIPSDYVSVFSCHFPKAYWYTIYIYNELCHVDKNNVMYDSVDYNTKLLNVMMDNEPISYPKTFKGLTTSTDGLELDTDDMLLRIHGGNSYHEVFNIRLMFTRRFMTSYNGYTIFLNDVGDYHRIVMYVIKDSDNVPLTPNPNHLLMCYYLAMLDEGSLTDTDKEIFNIVTNNLTAIKDEYDFKISYEKISNNLSRYLKYNNINFNTICKIITSAIVSTYETVTAIYPKKDFSLRLSYDYILFRQVAIVGLVSEIIKDVTSFDITERQRFKLVK